MLNLRLNYLIFILYVFVFSSGQLHAEQIKAATADWQPYAMLDENGLLQGIAYEVFREILKRTNTHASVHLLPTKRLNLHFDNNLIDINFADSPDWNPQVSNPQYLFSEPYAVVSEYIYFLKEKYLPILKPEDLMGKTVGISFGYYYGLFEGSFNSGDVKKYEAHDSKKLILMLKYGRIDATFYDDVTFNYHLNQLGYSDSDFIRGLRLTQAPLTLKIRLEKQALLEKFNVAIRQMKEDGTIEKLVSKYTRMSAPMVSSEPMLSSEQ